VSTRIDMPISYNRARLFFEDNPMFQPGKYWIRLNGRPDVVHFSGAVVKPGAYKHQSDTSVYTAVHTVKKAVDADRSHVYVIYPMGNIEEKGIAYWNLDFGQLMPGSQVYVPISSELFSNKLKQLNESIKQAQAFLQEKEGVTKQLASVHPHLCKGLEKEISTALQAGASYDLFTQLHANCLKIEEATINYAKNPGLTNQQQVSQTYEESLRSMATLLSKLVNNKLQKNDKKMMDFLQKKGIKVDQNDEQKIDAKNLNATSCYHLLKAFAPRLSPYFFASFWSNDLFTTSKNKRGSSSVRKSKRKARANCYL